MTHRHFNKVLTATYTVAFFIVLADLFIWRI